MPQQIENRWRAVRSRPTLAEAYRTIDLPQACRDHYSRPVALSLWVLCEVAIAACDLAEVIGSAIALKLLFGIPVVIGVCITAADVLAIIYIQHKGFRYLEALVIVLIV